VTLPRPPADHAHASHHGHEHGHAQAHDHGAHAPKHFGRAFAISIALNLAFVIVEAVYGLYAHSMALLADAGHNLGDVLGLALAWGATVLARRSPSQTHTYGLRRATIVAALANAVLLLVAVGAIVMESVHRLAQPAPVAGVTVIAVAAVGILVNGFTARLLYAGREHDLNLRGAYLHMVYDALVSLGVVVAGGVIVLTGWSWLDPAVSLTIAAVILMGTWSLLKGSLGMSLDAVPKGVSLNDVNDFLRQQPGVSALHDLHVWPMSTTETALTCHCVMPGGHPGDAFLVQLAHELQVRFGIHHATIQIEVDAEVSCALESDQVV
jgi:cobalt-zinc-cadmium efflux system protein